MYDNDLDDDFVAQFTVNVDTGHGYSVPGCLIMIGLAVVVVLAFIVAAVL
jgi:hypothetical protein